MAQTALCAPQVGIERRVRLRVGVDDRDTDAFFRKIVDRETKKATLHGRESLAWKTRPIRLIRATHVIPIRFCQLAGLFLSV